jgi:hypothetical protein
MIHLWDDRRLFMPIGSVGVAMMGAAADTL